MKAMLSPHAGLIPVMTETNVATVALNAISRVIGTLPNRNAVDDGLRHTLGI
jgi:hypothetical protein